MYVHIIVHVDKRRKNVENPQIKVFETFALVEHSLASPVLYIHTCDIAVICMKCTEGGRVSDE